MQKVFEWSLFWEGVGLGGGASELLGLFSLIFFFLITSFHVMLSVGLL